LKNAGEVVLAVFFIGECDFDSMGFDLSGRNFAKTIAKDSGSDTSPDNRACADGSQTLMSFRLRP
jgi:hypothetical protein